MTNIEGKIVEGKLSKPRMCCSMGCTVVAEYEVTTLRDGGGLAGPDPYSDQTDACTDHVGGLLGYQPDAVDPKQIYWEVRYLEGRVVEEE